MKIKHIIFLFIISIIILMSFSCPSELIKGTVWEGTLKLKDDFDIEVTFYSNNEINLYMKDKDADKSTLYKGSYYITNDTNSFAAKTKANAHFDGDGTIDSSKINLEGELSFYNGIGSGDFEIDYYKTFDPDEHFDGEWELEKVE